MAYLNVNNLKTLVAIGILDKRKKFVCKATGFLVGFIARNSKDPSKRTYYFFLVTNRHVFEGKEQVYLRMNKIGGGAEVFRQPLSFPGGDTRWLTHRNKKVDIAMMAISPQVLQKHKLDFTLFNQEMFAYYRDFEKIGIEVGDEVYVLGFPMGIAGELQNYPYVKWGIISRTDSELVKETKAFLVDSSIFPGNSGGPVVLRPALGSLQGTKSVSQIYLLGVVSRYLPYEERLYTIQTTPPSVVSLERENSGLSYAVPMDFVRQIFNNWKKRRKKLEKAQKQKREIKREVEETREKGGE